MSLLTIAKNYHHITSIILSYLNYTSRRNLFFANPKLQLTLTKHHAMKQFSNIIKHQTLTFYFPPIQYDKNGYPKRKKHQASIKTIVNAGAAKIICHTCNKPFFNTKHEKQFPTCETHQQYKWHDNKMYITKKGYDKLGNRHNSKRHFQPNGTTRQLVLCNVCHDFLYYHTNIKTIKALCAHCNLQQENTSSPTRTVATQTHQSHT